MALTTNKRCENAVLLIILLPQVHTPGNCFRLLAKWRAQQQLFYLNPHRLALNAAWDAIHANLFVFPPPLFFARLLIQMAIILKIVLLKNFFYLMELHSEPETF